ncbi:endosialin-like [Girardinichthys multiradiatus]|uniref:endosialin-like n=1 Tax=Girardinichthys multiradiatus TaxID=208333 RepID=UPI001FABBB46|nr:endosialin-like [Girardinichthys multiradiatus]
MSLLTMLIIKRRSSSSMALLCIVWLLTVYLAPGSHSQRMGEPDEDLTAAGAKLGERDAICNQNGCYAVFFQKRNFREARQACLDQSGTLVTMHTHEEAGVVHNLLSSTGVHGSRARLRLWIGLHRPPRQCSATKPLRGFVWVTGNQDAQFTNWIRKEMPSTCALPRCVAMTMHTSDSGESGDNFRWAEGPCPMKLDGFICQYTYRGMCSPLEDEGRGPAVYETPFHFKSTQLTHVPYGSVAHLPCPTDSSNPAAPSRESVLCIKRDDGTVGWPKDPPLCSSSITTRDQDWCSGEHNCEQHCQNTDDDYSCYCSEGYILDEDGYSCKLDPLSQTDPPKLSDSAFAPDQPLVNRMCMDMGCEYDCSITPRSIRCTCPPGYQIGPDGRKCLDVDECQQQPCPQFCINTPGTFLCICYPGYQPDSTDECADIDECLDEGTCEGSCENTEGSFTCLCDHGYMSNSDGDCIDLDECEEYSPCHQQCLNFAGGYQCNCDSGFELKEDGLTCQPSKYDEEYSTLTSDPSNYDDQDIPWSTRDPYVKADGNFSVNWLTDAPQGLTPDMAHQSDNHLNQWDHLSPRQYQTVPSPTQKMRTGNNIEDNAPTGGSNPNNRMVLEMANKSSSETEEAKKPKMDSTSETNTTSEIKDGSVDGKRKHDKSWLLVALLVPLCVFLVVMLALGIVYCTSCAVDKSLSFADCYHWVLPATPPDRREGKTHA